MADKLSLISLLKDDIHNHGAGQSLDGHRTELEKGAAATL
jgi:hypothetical protein